MQLSTTYESDKTPNILAVASKDKTRPVLTAVHLDTDRAVLEATDSYCLAAIPVTVEEGDVPGLIPAEAIAALQKAQKAERYVTLSMRCEAETVTLVTPEGEHSWRRPVGQYPNVPALLPEPSSLSGFRICFNAKRLLNVAAAIGTDEVTVTFCRQGGREEGEGTGFFPNNLRPIIVSNGNHGETALLMPIRLKD